MKVCDLFEAEKTDSDKKLLPVDSIAMMLFKQKAGLVKDPKRDKKKDYLGVSHQKSTIKTAEGRQLFLTFDNSTDSGEFEIDSLTPLKIEKGGDIDKQIKKLFTKYELETKSSTGYVVKSDVSYLREISLGKKLGHPAVKLVSSLIKILKQDGSSDKDETVDDKKEEASDTKKTEKKPEKKVEKEE